MDDSKTFLIFAVCVIAFGLGTLAGRFSGDHWQNKHWQQETVKHNAAVWKTLPDGTVEWSWKPTISEETK